MSEAQAAYEKIMEAPGTLWKLEVICKTLDTAPLHVIVVGVEANRALKRDAMISILEAAISSVMKAPKIVARSADK